MRKMISVFTITCVLIGILAVPALAAQKTTSKNYIMITVSAYNSTASSSVLSDIEGTTSTYGVISVYNGSTRVKRVENTNYGGSAYKAYAVAYASGTSATGSSSAKAAGQYFSGPSIPVAFN